MPNYGLGPRASGNASALNLSAATVVKASPGTVVRVNITTAGSGTVGCKVYDAATTASASASNLIASIPDAVGSTYLDFPCFTGIVVVPDTAQVVSVSYS